MTAAEVGRAFRAAVEARDLAAMASVLDPQVRFYSPVAFTPFEGRDVVLEVLAQVMEVFADFAYTDELEGEQTHALVFRARVGGRDVEGLDHLRLAPPDEGGLVRTFTVMVRPLSAAIALAEQMGPRVAHLKG